MKEQTYRTGLWKVLSVVLASSFVLGLAPMYTHAETLQPGDYSADNSLSSLLGDGMTFLSPDEVINNTYWADLEAGSVTNKAGTTYYGVFPKNLLKPNETALSGIGFDENTGIAATPNVGISPSGLSLASIDMSSMVDELGAYRFGYLVGNDTYGPPNTGLAKTDPIPDYVNPYGFKESDLLTQAEIKDMGLLAPSADLKAVNSTDSTSIGEYAPGDALNLEFSMDVSGFRRFMNGLTLNYTRTGYMSPESIQRFYTEAKGQYDTQLVFTIDIPEGVTVNDPAATLNGLNDVATTTRIDGKKLIVSARLSQESKTSWQDVVKKINAFGGQIQLTLSGLSIDNNVEAGKDILLRGTASGFFDFAVSDFKDNNPVTSHAYLYAVAQQNAAGLDQGAEANKPKQISYSLKVVKPKVYDVTYQFASGTDGRALPADVTKLLPAAKTGQKDGATIATEPKTFDAVKVNGGTWTFTGWDKESVTLNGAAETVTGTWTYTADPVTPEAKNTTTTVKKGTPPKTGDSNMLLLYSITLLLSGALLIVLRRELKPKK